MANAEGQKTVVIPRCDERVRDLFTAICEDHLQIERADAFACMLRPFVERVIQDIELNPDHDDLAVKTIRREVEALLPKERPGGLVG